MISTGFSALDNCIGGLKKGKLYTLAGFNFTPPWIVEHFAINMIANSRSYGVVHANYLPQSAGNFFGCKIFFSVGENNDSPKIPSVDDKEFRFLPLPAAKNENIDKICGRFSVFHKMHPFDIAVFDIRHIDLPKRKFPSTSGKRADHITGIFQKLAEAHNIPIILLDEFCNLDIAEKVSTNQFRRFLCNLGHNFEWDEHMYSIQLKPTSYSNALQKSVENLIVIYQLPYHDTQFDLAVFQQGKSVAEFEVCSQVEADISPGKNK